MPARGRPVGTKTRPWQDALERAARELGEGREKKLLIAARKVVESAINGDMTAAKELGDRLDGRATQTQIIDATVTNHMVMAPPPEKDADEWAGKHGPH